MEIQTDEWLLQWLTKNKETVSQYNNSVHSEVFLVHIGNEYQFEFEHIIWSLNIQPFCFLVNLSVYPSPKSIIFNHHKLEREE